jgi:hypothetical protein
MAPHPGSTIKAARIAEKAIVVNERILKPLYRIIITPFDTKSATG